MYTLFGIPVCTTSSYTHNRIWDIRISDQLHELD